MESRAFTLKSDGIMRVISTEVLILSNVTDGTGYTPRMWKGIWDTGATKTSIDKKVVEEMHLVSIGKISVSTANGVILADTYKVDVGLPNGVMLKDVIVSACELGNACDMLIGMDIMGFGDMALTHKNNNTTFSFRIPAKEEIDFCKR